MANIMGYDMGGGTGNAARKGYYVAQVKKPPITQNKQVVPASTNNYDWGGYTSPTYEEPSVGNAYADYLAQIQAAREEAIAKANAAIDEQTKVAEQKYNSQKKQIGIDYQNIKNQNSVSKAKLEKWQKETLANQGRLDSGAGRMEETTLRNNFANNLNSINLQEQSELDAIANAIAELYANAGAMKAQNNLATIDNYANALMYGLNSGALSGYSYNPATSDYYAQAQNIANTPYTTTSAVNDGQFAKASTAAILKALEDQWANTASGNYIGRRTGGGAGNIVR